MADKPNAFRGALRALLPQKASFRALIVVHEVINIPLTSGSFALRWRIHNAHSVPLKQPVPSLDKGKAKAADESSGGSIEDASSLTSDGASSSSPRKNSSLSSGSGDSVSHSGKNSYDYAYEPYGNAPSYSQYVSADAPPESDHEEDLDLPDDYVSSAKGRTHYLPLVDSHSIIYNHRVDVNVDMGVDRDTRALQDCDMRLEITQDVSTAAKEHDRKPFGVVHINLAEYARKGMVTRRHLLKKSKANAIIKVTVSLTQTGGETDFKAPALQEGQIMSGVSGLMSREGLLSSALMVEQYRQHLALHRAQNGSATLPATTSSSVDASNSSVIGYSPRTSSFALSQDGAPSPLPSSATENIIDALFNPYPSSSSRPSPFTIPSPERSHLPSRAPSPGPEDKSDDESRRLSSENGHVTDGSSSSHPRKPRPGWWKLGKSNRTTANTPIHSEAPSGATTPTPLKPALKRSHTTKTARFADDNGLLAPSSASVFSPEKKKQPQRPRASGAQLSTLGLSGFNGSDTSEITSGRRSFDSSNSARSSASNTSYASYTSNFSNHSTASRARTEHNLPKDQQGERDWNMQTLRQRPPMIAVVDVDG